jgi:hypothetical protein
MDEERRLVEELEALPFKAFDFHGHLGRRRVVSFGWQYDFAKGELLCAAKAPRGPMTCPANAPYAAAATGVRTSSLELCPLNSPSAALLGIGAPKR